MTTSEDIFREFLESFPDNRPKSIRMLAENAVFITPYIPDGFSSTEFNTGRFEGRDAIAPVFMMAHTLYSNFKWTKLEIIQAADPSICAATASSYASLKDGSIYENSYAFFVRIVDGFITEFTEFFDPRPINRALTLEKN